MALPGTRFFGAEIFKSHNYDEFSKKCRIFAQGLIIALPGMFYMNR